MFPRENKKIRKRIQSTPSDEVGIIGILATLAMSDLAIPGESENG